MMSQELTKTAEATGANGASRTPFGGTSVARALVASDPHTAHARAEVILNATAGTGECERAAERLEAIFGEGEIDAHVTLARDGEEIIETARRAATDDATHIVVAGGGDGTINAVASQIVGTDKVLGVLPFGTLNHFAKDLHIPLDVDEAARTILVGHLARVDVGEVNGRYFLNNSSLGLYPVLVHEREKLQERAGQGKWRAAARAAVTVLRRYPFVNVRLDADGKEMRRRTPFVFIGNNEYELEAFRVGTRARLDAGLLSLHVTRDIGRMGLARLAVRALFGRLREDKDFDALNVREVWIETHHTRLRVATDGEVTVMRPPLYYRVLPGALRVCVPREAEADEREERILNGEG
jgi:diacylglycerol kinase family enzyme